MTKENPKSPIITLSPSSDHLPSQLCGSYLGYFDVSQSWCTVTCWMVDVWFVVIWPLPRPFLLSLISVHLSRRGVTLFSLRYTSLSWPVEPGMGRRKFRNCLAQHPGPLPSFLPDLPHGYITSSSMDARLLFTSDIFFLTNQYTSS